jgi:heme exporter protein B
MTTTASPPERKIASAPPGLWQATAALLRKDFAHELRTRQTVPAMALFSVTVFVLFHFGLARDTVSGSLASGILWVTLLLAAVVGLNRLFAAERDGGAGEGLLLAPIDRTAIYVAKAAALLLYLALLEVVALPAFALLLDPGLGGGLAELIAILALADVGVAAVGALVAGLAAEARAREVIVPLMLLPLLVPVLIAAANASRPLLEARAHAAGLAKWLGLIGLYDVVFILVAVAVFDYLLDD